MYTNIYKNTKVYLLLRGIQTFQHQRETFKGITQSEKPPHCRETRKGVMREEEIERKLAQASVVTAHFGKSMGGRWGSRREEATAEGREKREGKGEKVKTIM